MDQFHGPASRTWSSDFGVRLGVIGEPVTGSSEAVARTQAHLDLAQALVEEGAVLLKNDNTTLPISSSKYKTIAVFSTLR